RQIFALTSNWASAARAVEIPAPSLAGSTVTINDVRKPAQPNAATQAANSGSDEPGTFMLFSSDGSKVRRLRFLQCRVVREPKGSQHNTAWVRPIGSGSGDIFTPAQSRQ